MSIAAQPQATANQQTALWMPTPEQMAGTKLAGFLTMVASRTGIDFGAPCMQAYAKLHRWSIEKPEEFWTALWDYCGVIGDRGQQVLTRTHTVPWASWFEDSRISYTENMLSRWQGVHTPAIIYRLQNGADRILSGQNLCEHVSMWVQALQRAGIGEGDCVAAYLPNVPETDILLLAASHIGAVFCSAGMEMGGDDLIARFSQARPKILITTPGYMHGEKLLDRTSIIKRAATELPGLERIIVLPAASQTSGLDLDIPKTIESADFLKNLAPLPLQFIRRPFNQPLYILFSSGTTGAPKCFVHSSGGILLKHLCEYQLQCDIRSGDRVFYHATPSWMMWNWAASALASGATLLKYDGNPMYPDAKAQWRFTSENACTHHGTAAPVIMGWKDAGMIIQPGEMDLSALRSLFYTGAVLPESGFHYLEKAIPKDVPVYGLAGGTDLVGCHVSGNPFAPVFAGQVPGPVLGMDIQIWDEHGQPEAAGQAGELVCVNPFPSMPLHFLNDPDGARYRDAYFDFYPDQKVWRHGDSIQQTAEGQILIIGRSDATLNQNGVRIGTVAIYGQLTAEKIGPAFAGMIKGAAAVDFMRPDTKQGITVLFLHLEDYAAGVPEDLAKAIKKAVKDNVGPYSIPTEITAAPGVLKTPNGKLAEVVMRKAINGAVIPNPTLYGAVELVTFFENTGKQLTAKYAADSGPTQKPG
jgi:acetoacetyl-CoA synthetase